jgi:hypothetical protein
LRVVEGASEWWCRLIDGAFWACGGGAGTSIFRDPAPHINDATRTKKTGEGNGQEREGTPLPVEDEGKPLSPVVIGAEGKARDLADHPPPPPVSVVDVDLSGGDPARE